MKINGEIIRELRKENGLRLSDVAARLHVTEATISRYESGDIQRASPSIINAYSKLFRVPINYICENMDSDWVEVLQGASLKDPRVAGFIQYLEEQAEREMNSEYFGLSDFEKDVIVALRNADDKTRNLVLYALGCADEGKEGD